MTHDPRPSPSDQALVPPHSNEAEQSVLGSIMLDNLMFDHVADLIQAGHFYNPEYARIYGAIERMCMANKLADVLTVAESTGMGVGELNALCMSVHTPRNAKAYAEIVATKWVERQLMHVGSAIAATASAEGDPAEKIDKAMSALSALVVKKKAHESVDIGDALVRFLDRLQDEAQGVTEVISTGLRDLDRLLAGGLRKGELMVVGARPKMGKTAFTLQIARNVAPHHGVLICSQEMPVHELTSRHVAALGGVNLAEMRRPESMSDETWSRVSEAVEVARSYNMALDEQRALKLLDIRRKVMEEKRRRKLGLVIVDYLQLMAGDGDNRNQELDRISNGLKAMAGEFDVAVVLLSQLSREADKRHGPPVMTDLRDSGAIEAAADIIAMLYREVAHPLGEKGEMWKHHAQMEVVQRNGAPGTVDLWFSGEYQQFKDWAGARPMRMSMSRAASGGARRKGLD